MVSVDAQVDTQITVVTGRGGKTHIGRWMLADEMVTVWLGLHGPHCTQLGGMPPEILARVLLDELMDRTEDRGNTG